jgi:hypothetical protein
MAPRLCPCHVGDPRAADEQGYAALLDSADLAQQPDAVLDAALRTMAPGTRRDDAEARAAQIEIDRRIVARMVAENFAGPATTKLLLAAYEYAHPVVGYLISTGQIFGECARLGRPVKRQQDDTLWTDDDRSYLTECCVDMGIFHVFYEYGLKKGRWDPRRGTALTTYAVNACSLCFPSVYRKWLRGRMLEHSFQRPSDRSASLPG